MGTGGRIVAIRFVPAVVLASILALGAAATARADTSVPSPSVGNNPTLPFGADSAALGPAARTSDAAGADTVALTGREEMRDHAM